MTALVRFLGAELSERATAAPHIEDGMAMYGKQGAYSFLKQMHEHLNISLPPPNTVRARIITTKNNLVDGWSPKSRDEDVFLGCFILPEIWKCLQFVPSIGSGKACEAIRSEYYKKYPKLASANTRRIQGHPFDKKYPFNFEENYKKIMNRWKLPESNSGFILNEAYPDICVTDPFPFKVVFDIKYFKGESLAAAERDLVAGVYEAAFYRGIPEASPEHSPKTKWGYDWL